MLFNSIAFAIFLPIVFLLYWFVFQKHLKLQNLFIVVVSYIFYGWWDWRFLVLIALTSFCSWGSGLLIATARESVNHPHPSSVADSLKNRIYTSLRKINWPKFISGANIVLNLLILAFFKYFNFFVESFVDFFALLGVRLQSTALQIILPVGISFYTFQALSYSIDVYRKKIEPTKDVVAFFAFVGFFPQLVAGPIERATNLLPQFCKSRTFNYDQAVDGIRQILWGLFKKIVIADNCAVYVNEVFANYTEHSGSTLLLAAILFAFQIYGDFSGYSDIAIGTAKLFGITLMRNFNLPYFSRDIAEFWRRWHISLNTWFVDYLYIPLGGSRPYVNPDSKHPKLSKKAKVIRNTFAIFLISGLWHGANWTFVCWGLYHALLFIPLILSGKNKRFTGVVAENRELPTFKEMLQMGLTFFLVVIGWIFFRAETITQAFDYLSSLFTVSLMSVPKTAGQSALIMNLVIMILVEWFHRTKSFGFEISYIKSPCLRSICYFILLFILFAFGGHTENFIYFQF